MEDRKTKLLKQLEEFFKEDEDAAEVSFFTKEELNSPMDVLRVLITDYGPGLMSVLAEFFFIPFGGLEEVWYFSSVITILTDIPKDGVSALSGAISRLNFYLPYGSFCINSPGNVLVYKSVATLRTDRDDTQLREDMELSADTALLVPESYTELLAKTTDGRMLLSDFIATLPQ